MVSSESGFQLKGAGPEAYERYMIPIHCRTRVADLLDRVSPQPGEHILDVACGTGIVSRNAALRVGQLGHVTGVELNPAMLKVAREMAKYLEQIEFLEGNALDLPVPDSQFDVVLCQAAIQFIPDREKAIREMYRALKPGGRVGLNVFRTAEFNPAFDNLIAALEKCAGPEAAMFLRAPFVMNSVAEMRSLFEQAGFKDIRVVIRIETVRYPSVAHLVRYETLNIPDPEIQKDETQEALTRHMEKLVEAHVDDHGVVFPAQDFVVVAKR